MRFFVMFVTAVCVLFLIKLRWPKKKNFYKLKSLFGFTPPNNRRERKLTISMVLQSPVRQPVIQTSGRKPD